MFCYLTGSRAFDRLYDSKYPSLDKDIDITCTEKLMYSTKKIDVTYDNNIIESIIDFNIVTFYPMLIVCSKKKHQPMSVNYYSWFVDYISSYQKQLINDINIKNIKRLILSETFKQALIHRQTVFVTQSYIRKNFDIVFQFTIRYNWLFHNILILR